MAARFASRSAMVRPFFTTPDPGSLEAAIVLSRSRWLISDLGLSIAGGSAAHAVIVAAERTAVRMDFLILI